MKKGILGWLAALLVLPALAMAELEPLNDPGFDRLMIEQRGQVVLVDFWATWCPPCKWQIPELTRLWSRYREEGFTVVGVSLDARAEAVEKYRRKTEIPYPLYLGAGNLKRTQRVVAIPTTLLYDRDGTLVTRHEGFVDGTVLEAEIVELLEKKP